MNIGDNMVKIINHSGGSTLGCGLDQILRKSDSLFYVNGGELIINSNSGVTQNIFLGTIEKIQICDNYAIFYGLSGVRDFLNLENVLSISLMENGL